MTDSLIQFFYLAYSPDVGYFACESTYRYCRILDQHIQTQILRNVRNRNMFL